MSPNSTSERSGALPPARCAEDAIKVGVIGTQAKIQWDEILIIYVYFINKKWQQTAKKPSF
ncbi:hypothetical protein [Achromobacter spanius]|uniref:hypothetical protein n=1 Tax=Achromobacter spanius TaxID=217203 RepID=UPI003208084E